jgi:hypothetical protein
MGQSLGYRRKEERTGQERFDVPKEYPEDIRFPTEAAGLRGALDNRSWRIHS